MLADAEVQRPAVRVAGELLGLAVRRAGTTARPPSWCCCSRPGRPSRPTARAAPGRAPASTLPEALRVAMPFGVGRELGQRRRSSRPAASGCDSRSSSALPLRVGRGPGVEPLAPTRRARRGRGRRPRGRAPAPRRSTSKVCVRVEAEDLLGRGDLVGAERRAVGLAGVLLVRRGPADDRAQRDERRPVGLGLGRLERVARAPARPRGTAVRADASRRCCTCQPYAAYRASDVLGLGDVGVVLDRDVVVVVDQRRGCRAAGGRRASEPRG